MKLKIIVILLFIQNLQLSAQEIPNTSFENWEIINGIEEPSNWVTNNSEFGISVTKDTIENGLDNAIRITGNRPGFEGPLPGRAKTTLIYEEDYIIYGVKMKYKYTILEGFLGNKIGYGGFSFQPYSNGLLDYDQISGWSYTETESEENWIEEEFFFSEPKYTNEYDSIQFLLAAGPYDDDFGPRGNSELFIDYLEFISESITSLKDQELNEKISISPNPFQDKIRIDAGDLDVEEVILVDILGRTLFKSPFNEILDLGFVSHGTYSLQFIHKDGKKEVRKIQKF